MTAYPKYRYVQQFGHITTRHIVSISCACIATQRAELIIQIVIPTLHCFTENITIKYRAKF